MNSAPEPTLSDDEAALSTHAQNLVNAVERVVGTWIRMSIASRAPELALAPETDSAVSVGGAEIVAELAALLSLDIGDQTEGPLQVLRRGTSYATEVLAAANVAPVARDDFARQSFPADLFDLTPASFADVDSSLHEPGLVWGAAKAHVHLRRRRQADQK